MNRRAWWGALTTITLLSIPADAYADEESGEEKPSSPVVRVHIDSADSVVLERRHDNRWETVCSSPCDALVPRDGTYRVNGPSLRPSAPFRGESLAQADRLDLTVDAASSVSHGVAVGITVTGAVGFVPPDGYESCAGGIASLFATAWMRHPIIWAPPIVGSGLLGVGGTWLALSPPTRVAAAAPPSDATALPRALTMPIVSTTF